MNLQERRAELTAEREKGVQEFERLAQQMKGVQEALLRIDGAILIVDELIKEEEAEAEVVQADASPVEDAV